MKNLLRTNYVFDLGLVLDLSNATSKRRKKTARYDKSKWNNNDHARSQGRELKRQGFADANQPVE